MAKSEALQEESPANNESIALQVGLMRRDIQIIRRDVNDIKSKVEEQYVTRAEFEPIKKVVYGLIGLIMVAVVGALLGLIIIK